MLHVTVAWVTPEVQELVPVVLPHGATVADAIAQSGLATAYGFDPRALATGVAGKRCPPDKALADGDRVELWRPLIADPKDARRRRARAKVRPPNGRKSDATG